MRKALMLRGAEEMLSRAVRYIGAGQRTNDWNGEYMNPAVEHADAIFRKAIWTVQAELRKVNVCKA